MTALDIAELDICPWALREGIILRRLDTEPNGESAAQSDLLPATGRTVTNGAR